MRALLYDIHGNVSALDAVLQDATQQGADEYFLGGDVALFGPWPEATVERLRAAAAAGAVVLVLAAALAAALPARTATRVDPRAALGS